MIEVRTSPRGRTSAPRLLLTAAFLLAASGRAAEPPARGGGEAARPTRTPSSDTGSSGLPATASSAVVGVPGDPNVYYAGAASGGVWKSIDGGTHWKPVFDEEQAQSIGAIAIAPSDPNVVWVGTGETFIRSNVSLGNGVYKSTDAGQDLEAHGPREDRAGSAA